MYSVRDNIIEGDFIKMKETGLNISYGQIDRCFPCALPDKVSGNRNLET